MKNNDAEYLAARQLVTSCSYAKFPISLDELATNGFPESEPLQDDLRSYGPLLSEHDFKRIDYSKLNRELVIKFAQAHAKELIIGM
jgi:hypothetical protein